MSENELFDWAKLRGIETFGLQVTGTDVEERGLKGVNAIEEGALLVSAPLAAAITSQAAQQRFGHVWSSVRNPSLVHMLAIELLHHCQTHPDDPWVRSLPSKVDNWLSWSPADRAALKGCVKVEQLLAQQEKALEEAEKSLLTPVRASPKEFGEGFSPERFRWAVSLVLSRSFSVTLVDEPMLAVIPLVDLFNHVSLPGTSSSVSFDAKSSAFLIRAIQPSVPGAEVFITYGDKGNAELLTNYGFALGTNLSHVAAVSFGVPADDPLAMQKRMMLPRGLALSFDAPFEQDLCWSTPADTSSPAGSEGVGHVEVSPELLMLLRLCKAELTDMMKLPLLFQQRPMSVGSEIAALDALRDAANEAMAWTNGEVDGSLSIAACVKSLQGTDRTLLKAVVAYAEAAKRKVEADGIPEYVPEDEDDDDM
mmetsp:Transcript_69735/g.166945  ORF Transcript_69735/g.166945 Transcript_69735/m.166945 type:complete len:423 (-) Transcript_69735:127-1395(-)